MADIASALKQWSTTNGNNNPTSSTTLGTGLAPNLQQIQATLRNELATRSLAITATAITDIGVKDEGIVLVSNVTGTVAIASFGTVSAGMQKLVTFSITGGSLTLVYNSTTLMLPTQANIIVADGDSLLTESLGSGNWKVHAYYGVGATLAQSGFKNKIIGGDFTTNPWQRGSSFSAVGNAQYTADRWNAFIFTAATSAVATVAKVADTPTVAQVGIFTQHCLALTVTTAKTPLVAGDYSLFVQRIEGYNAASFGFGQAGTRNITLSFWVKSAKTGIHCVAFRNSANNRAYVAEYTVITANTWEYKGITVLVDTAGTWLYDTGMGLELIFTIAAGAGSTFNTTPNSWQTGNFYATANQVNELDTVGNNFKIALVQLEAGSVATSFETRGAGQEVILCQRYYQRNPTAMGIIFGTTPSVFLDSRVYNTGAAATTIVLNRSFPVIMRAAPTLSLYYDISDGATQGPVPASTSNTGGFFYGTVVGASLYIDLDDWTASAEL